MSGSVSIVGNLQWYMHTIHGVYSLCSSHYLRQVFTHPLVTAGRHAAEMFPPRKKKRLGDAFDCQLPLWQPQNQSSTQKWVCFIFPAVKPMKKTCSGFWTFSYKQKFQVPSRSVRRVVAVLFFLIRQKRTATSRADGWLVAPSGCRSWGKRWMCRIWLTVELHSMGLGYIYPHE